jgi:hypothetical protein
MLYFGAQPRAQRRATGLEDGHDGGVPLGQQLSVASGRGV